MLHFIQQLRIGTGKMSKLLQFVQDFKNEMGSSPLTRAAYYRHSQSE